MRWRNGTKRRSLGSVLDEIALCGGDLLFLDLVGDRRLDLFLGDCDAGTGPLEDRFGIESRATLRTDDLADRFSQVVVVRAAARANTLRSPFRFCHQDTPQKPHEPRLFSFARALDHVEHRRRAVAGLPILRNYSVDVAGLHLAVMHELDLAVQSERRPWRKRLDLDLADI